MFWLLKRNKKCVKLKVRKLFLHNSCLYPVYIWILVYSCVIFTHVIKYMIFSNESKLN